MKKYIFAFLLLPIYIFCQSPQTINYQGYLENSGSPVNGNETLLFEIFDQQSGGTDIWSSGNRTVSINSGVFNIILGENPMPAINLDWDGQYWLEITVDPTGSPQILPRIKISSGGYSLSTQKLEASDIAGQSAITAINAATTGTIESARLGTGTRDGSKFLRDDGTWQTVAAAGGSTVAIRAYKNAIQSINAGNTAQVTFELESYDTGNNFASNQFTAPENGYYLIHFNSTLGTNTIGTLEFRVGGTTVAKIGKTSNSGYDEGIALSSMVFMNQNEVLDVYMRCEVSGGVVTMNAGENASYITIIKLD